MSIIESFYILLIFYS